LVKKKKGKMLREKLPRAAYCARDPERRTEMTARMFPWVGEIGASKGRKGRQGGEGESRPKTKSQGAALLDKARLKKGAREGKRMNCPTSLRNQ